MPVIRKTVGPQPVTDAVDTLNDLFRELHSPQEFGQPLIEEEEFSRTGLILVTVIWDRWEGLADQARSAIILQAYEQAKGVELRNRIGVSLGLTVPEAVEMGKLPYSVVPLLRKTDPVGIEDCRRAMIKLGASVLAGPDRPVLRFPTEAEAGRYRLKLTEILPGSEPVWAILQDPHPVPAE